METNHGRAKPEDSLSTRPSRPNQRLKELRSRLGISTRDVSERSQHIAEAESNPEFHISNAWLTQVENSDSIPSIHKLYSLSAIYRVKITELFLLFGIDLTKLAQHQLRSQLATTHLTTLDAADPDGKVLFPVRFDPSFDVRHTNLLSRMIEVWAKSPWGSSRVSTSETTCTATSALRITCFIPFCARVLSYRLIRALEKSYVVAG